ncbi:PepSY-associated TM helix domain-containing protein [Eilatimonas milleporae]|uniref:PepSY-associated transmembrane protein n=1 Tax=Eilatimonas milleporae TaxID=911205 RepID=A0A3M0C4M2_9PROT|nr:PepSY-associated TM helix domain-containing protein [Eilatimonas milleporae]RMB04801.1 PepSY-associated transmembrane protein [Eilatimonas milleporae]
MANALKLKRWSLSKHQTLGLVGGLALVLWGLSGLLHPLMTTFGPQQAVFYPPQRPLDLTGARPLHDTLRAAGITRAAAVKIIVSDGENLLQVTENAMEPRRYFRLSDGMELAGHDTAHAVFLARHYLGVDDPVRTIRFVKEFDDTYPWVNRLLPVYQVTFERQDDLSIHVYTETNASAAVTNRFKTVVQTGFRWFHTWSWFPTGAEWARVLLVALFIGALFALAVTGVMMLVLIRRKGRAPGSRGWHRIAGYALALPMLMFSASGLFHLIQYAADTPEKVLTLSPPLDLGGVRFPVHRQWTDLTAGMTVNALSLVETADGVHLYRLGLAPDRRGGPTGAAEIRNARFDGVETTGPALYVNAATGAVWPDGDKELAMQLGARFTGAGPDAIRAMSLVTRFGPSYDFRNKRLPVWRIDYGAPENMTIFVDTATGVLADRVLDTQKPERLSFSLIHKWNFLFPLGRTAQNIIISAVVALSIVLMAVLGLQMDVSRRIRRKAKKETPATPVPQQNPAAE